MFLNKVKVIGCGGIANWLLPPLAHYINANFASGEITLIDGDQYEEKNRDRQTFTGRGNKAEVTAERFKKEFKNVFFWPQPVYIVASNIVQLIRENDIIFSCVDNHKTRKLISDRSEELGNVTLISGGNDYTDGNIQVFIKRDGKDVTLPIANKYHNEIQEPVDKNPGEELLVKKKKQGCQAIIETAPQLIWTNFAIASKMGNAYYGLIQGVLDYDEVYTDILTNSARPVKRKRTHEKN